jgi:serine protease Do
MTLDLLGIVLVPDIIAKTPPFVDHVVGGSVAAKLGLLADDLIVEINGNMTPSRREVEEQLSAIGRDAVFPITIQRGTEFLNFDLQLIQRLESDQ